MRWLGIVMAIICLSGPAAAAQGGQPTPEERSQLDWVSARGHLLFELDRAAWLGTDDMIARLRDYRTIGLRGYVVERDGDAFVVTFYGGAPDNPVAFYRGRVENRRIVSRDVFDAASRPALTALQRRLATARETANRLGHRPCGRAPFNTVAVPPDTADQPIDLYLLTPQAREGEFPMGGHFRATINADGTIGSNRAFTRSCLPMPRPENGVALFVTHLLDPIPTEIHVFTSFASGVPVLVAAGGRVFAVVRENISLTDVPLPGSPKT